MIGSLARRALACAAVALCVSAHAADDVGYCEIPALSPGVPSVVHVASLAKGLCGVVRVGQRYVQVEQQAIRTTRGPVSCVDRELCEQRLTFYLSDSDRPFIVILRGPREATS